MLHRAFVCASSLLDDQGSGANLPIVTPHPVAKFGSCSQQAAFRGCDGDAQNLSHFRHGPLLDIPQQKDIAQQRRSAANLVV